MHERYSEGETNTIAQKLLALVTPYDDRATVVGLSGDLGAGKTTLTKAIGKTVGVEETIQSPTFVIGKFYDTNDDRFKKMVHIDAYRIESENELTPLGWDNILQSPQTLIIIEWPERIKASLPADTHLFTINHDNQHRIIIHEKN
ncbi:MAG TPA: tRNA (adenosine(37)-N6)-threonylcarbamoyltransferase complex ATPase subunit type 1 TsaE [Candidatus Paceibacterota bacterium]|jgi:tRNA threonylcarbamoyladenosine biosynthesis protein TsaE|nr:tRNA (adenosine(37)-N6)-threonylcarbamoyltransferase complex ATPase subunit type 1 TsaE [Candidatus Paceibacterota bacterium]